MSIEGAPTQVDGLSINIDRPTAVQKADEFLTRLPLTKALSIKHGIQNIKDYASHPSILDLWDQDKPHASSNHLRAPSPAIAMRDRVRRVNKFNANPIVESNVNEEGMTAKQILSYESSPGIHLTLREVSNLFDPVLGVLKVPAKYRFDSSHFAEFYTAERRIGSLKAKQGEIELSGIRSHVADIRDMPFERRLEIINEDVHDALKYVEEVYQDRSKIEDPKDYLLFLGVLDLLKTHSLTLFHLATYEERDFKFPEQNLIEYFDRKMMAMHLMEDSVRMYYQTLLGLDYDVNVDFERAKMGYSTLTNGLNSHLKTIADTITEPTADYSLEQRKIQAHKFKTPETSNPIIIALGVQEIVKKYPSVEIVCGIPSGGTEVAVVAQMFYELSGRKPPASFYLPISLHSETHASDVDSVTKYLATNFGGVFRDKQVLVVDDNTSSGSTFKIAAQAMYNNQARDIKFHVVDLDVRRLIMKENNSKEYFNSEIIRGTTVGVVKVNSKGGYSKKLAIMNRIGQAAAVKGK